MRIDKTNEHTVLHYRLIDAPSLQMSSSGGLGRYYTFSPKTAVVSIVNGAFDSIILRHDHSMLRMFDAQNVTAPNWVRDLVVEILGESAGTWPLAGVRVNEYRIERFEQDASPAMTMAVVLAAEVRDFLLTERDRYTAGDFLVVHDGDETMTGDAWLRATKFKVAS